jgi:hypothetical protein
MVRLIQPHAPPGASLVLLAEDQHLTVVAQAQLAGAEQGILVTCEVPASPEQLISLTQRHGELHSEALLFRRDGCPAPSIAFDQRERGGTMVLTSPVLTS